MKMASVVYSHQFSWPARWAEESKTKEGAPNQIVRMDEAVPESDASPATEESNPSAYGGMIGEREGLKSGLSHVKTVARTDSTVLLERQTGTGKELISKEIHTISHRKTRNFVKLN